MDVPHVAAVWLHTVAFVIAWGYYGVLARIVIPALRRSLDRQVAARTLVEVERRALPLVGLSVVLFIATGSYLLVTDPAYAGLGNFFATTWTTLMLVKHLVLVGLVALGVAVHALIVGANEAPDPAARERSTGLAELAAEAATAVGAVVALLTAAAQASA